jgi:hypothetical protein
MNAVICLHCNTTSNAMILRIHCRKYVVCDDVGLDCRNVGSASRIWRVKLEGKTSAILNYTVSTQNNCVTSYYRASINIRLRPHLFAHLEACMLIQCN